jgi:hypothetical protein
LDDEDLTYIPAILGSLSWPTSNSQRPIAASCATLTAEGVQVQAQVQLMPPPKFNQKFNQKFTIYNSEARKFSCFLNFEEEGTAEFADYFSDEEDNSLHKEDSTGESDTWSQSNFDELGEISDEEDAWSKIETTKSGLKSINEIIYKGTGEKNNLKGISIISNEAKLAFSAWQPYIPPEPVF